MGSKNTRLSCLAGLLTIITGLFFLLAACGGGGALVEGTPAATPVPPRPPQASEPGEIWLSPIDEMPLAYVPAGPFLMGSVEGDPEADFDEFPQRKIYLDAFWMDQYEVTNRMYDQCVLQQSCDPLEQNSSLTRLQYTDDLAFAEYPVVNMTWGQAASYCRWAGRRLPGEAEWEKAARGPDGQTFPWGSEAPSCEYAGFANPGPGRGACVEDIELGGSFPAGASPYGVFDMSGNVWEWVNDWYAPGAYQDMAADNPAGPTSGEEKVMRGGAFNGGGQALRAANRSAGDPQIFNYFTGFRCAVSASP